MRLHLQDSTSIDDNIVTRVRNSPGSETTLPLSMNVLAYLVRMCPCNEFRELSTPTGLRESKRHVLILYYVNLMSRVSAIAPVPLPKDDHETLNRTWRCQFAATFAMFDSRRTVLYSQLKASDKVLEKGPGSVSLIIATTPIRWCSILSIPRFNTFTIFSTANSLSPLHHPLIHTSQTIHLSSSIQIQNLLLEENFFETSKRFFQKLQNHLKVWWVFEK